MRLIDRQRGFLIPSFFTSPAGLLLMALAVAALVIGASGAAWTARGWKADRDINEIRADLAEKREKAITDARQDERQQQEKVDAALRKNSELQAAINDRLLSDIDRLRQRPERPAGASQAPRANCTGANGAELGGSHAIFLARFAAGCARQDAALALCYAALDAGGVK